MPSERPIYSLGRFSPSERHSELKRQAELRRMPIRWAGIVCGIGFQIAIAVIILTLFAIIEGDLILPF